MIRPLSIPGTIFAVCTIPVVLAGHWGYHKENGPRTWSKSFPECKGEKQSPINIDSYNTVYDPSLEGFKFINYGNRKTPMKLVNNGHSVQVNLGKGTLIKGGCLKHVYNAAQFHFHWGSDSTKGSEHQINSKSFPMEMHIVHYSSEFANLSQALNKANGLAVLGFFFEIGEKNNAMEKIIQSLKLMPYPGDEVQLKDFSLLSVLPRNKDGFFSYFGSLTSPPCYETVIWSIFEDTIEISEEQMHVFQTTIKESRKTKEVLVNNYRSIMPQNSRQVYRSLETIYNAAINKKISLILYSFSYFGRLMFTQPLLHW